MYRDAPRPTRLEDYRPPEFLIDRVDLRFDLDPELTRVGAELEIRRNPAATRGDGSLTLHGEQLVLEQIAIDGNRLTPAEYREDAESLTILRVPDRFRLTTRVTIHPSLNTALEGLYQSGDLLCTQCEAEGFRRITYFLDRPDVMAVYTVTLRADKARYPVLLSNGNLVEAGALDGGRHWRAGTTPSRSPATCSRWWPATWCARADRIRTRSGRDTCCRSTCARRPGQDRPRDGLAEAAMAGTRRASA
jgi:aminopeptidase N